MNFRSCPHWKIELLTPIVARDLSKDPGYRPGTYRNDGELIVTRKQILGPPDIVEYRKVKMHPDECPVCPVQVPATYEVAGARFAAQEHAQPLENKVRSPLDK